MKKFSLILIMLFIFTFGVWAATDASDTLHISTTVVDRFGLVIHTEEEPESISDFNSLTSAGTVGDPILYDDEDIYGNEERVLTVSAMTNRTSNYKVEVVASPLSATGVNTKIGYTVRIVGSPDTSINVLETDTSKTFNLTTFNATGGLFIVNQKFGITISLEDFEAAGAGDYSTEWTVSLTTT